MENFAAPLNFILYPWRADGLGFVFAGIVCGARKTSCDARTKLGVVWLSNIFRATTGGLLSPRDPLARLAAVSSARSLGGFYIRAGAAAPLRAAAPRDLSRSYME